MEQLFDLVSNYIEDFAYLGMFLALLIAGFGVPIPEDIILLASGYIVHLQPERLSIWIAVAVCMVGIFAGDTVLYWMGRVGGTRILRFPFLRGTITPRRLRKMEAYFKKYGDKTVFFARFFAGIRWAAFFSAGAMRMPYWKFISVDMLAAITSPIWIVLAYKLGEHIDAALVTASRIKHYIMAGVIVLLAVYLLFAFIRARRQRKGNTARDEQE